MYYNICVYSLFMLHKYVCNIYIDIDICTWIHVHINAPNICVYSLFMLQKHVCNIYIDIDICIYIYVHIYVCIDYSCRKNMYVTYIYT